MGPNDAPYSRQQYYVKVLSKILTLNILQSYEHLNWEVSLPNIGFGWETRALAPDLISLLLPRGTCKNSA
jgi:hypothetical protein